MVLKLSAKQRHAAATSSPAYILEPGPPAANTRRREDSNRPADVLLQNGRTLVQPRLPSLLHQLGVAEARRGRAPPAISGEDIAASDFAEAASDDPDIMAVQRTPPPTPGVHLRKREAQWKRWQQSVLPTLLPELACLFYETKSLRDLDRRQQQQRTACACKLKTLKIAILHFSSIEDVELQICKCPSGSATVQLMRLGAFGCAPLEPSVAVDLRVLEFARNLFLQISPNTTAFTLAFERTLSSMGFQLQHQNSLRRRFGNCLMWYTHLRNLMKEHYRVKIETVREEVYGPEIPISPPRGRTTERDTTPGRSSSASSSSSARTATPTTPTPAARNASRKRAREPTPEPPQVPFPEPTPRLDPSEYLRRRCPVCFGNLKHDPNEIADIIVCIDACFTQKKKKSPRDPEKTHPDTRFIPEEQARLTEIYVDGLRGLPEKNKTKRPKPTLQEIDEDDEYEFARLPLLRSVLDACEASFKAADEKREKASTDFFEDTALMGLLCRHDRVLFLANMHSAGEKQFYVIALIETLFQHLPLGIHVGLMYDVACTMERSCWKWGFLDRFMDRIAFAVSVFHAFGHEWACQLLYHPRKRSGFGFSNGEGAERFWKSIRHLIAHLRISGYHNRLYTLDAQMEHAEEASLLRLGEWINRRYRHCVQKRAEAKKELAKAGKSTEMLREQWDAQVAAQTRPPPRRTKTRGQQAVQAVIHLRAAVKTREVQVRELRQKFIDGVSDEDDHSALYETEWRAAQEALEKSLATLRRKEKALGVNEQQELQKLINSEYMRVRMNARALKLRLRQRLRARKFEMDVVERTYRRLLNDAKLHAHTESAVKRREPTITKVASEYNKLCGDIAKLIRAGKAPAGARAPLVIPPGGLWQLDVDDAIFEDVGLDDHDDDFNDELHLWLCDEKVRAGIKALLELDRAEEEEARLRREIMALRVWFSKEWKIAAKAIEGSTSVHKYHLRLHRDKLAQLCATWDKHLPNLGSSIGELPEWGPSILQLSRCRVNAHVAARGDDRHYGEESSLSDDEQDAEESDGEDDEFGTLEAVERADIYRMDDDLYV
ncbi:hypothetical protein DFH09DRAFT_1485992 [Mycena vulgaris]|nr:hypothetical protein DFH09DRAFT_1485992 [Mycena vulgaris]